MLAKVRLDLGMGLFSKSCYRVTKVRKEIGLWMFLPFLPFGKIFQLVQIKPPISYYPFVADPVFPIIGKTPGTRYSSLHLVHRSSLMRLYSST